MFEYCYVGFIDMDLYDLVQINSFECYSLTVMMNY